MRFSPHPVNCCLETPLVPFPPRRGRLALEPLPPLSCGIHAPKPCTLVETPCLSSPFPPHPDSIPAILPYCFGSMTPLLLWVSPSSLALSAQIDACAGWSWDRLAVATEVVSAHSLPLFEQAAWKTAGLRSVSPWFYQELHP